ncbi:MAG: cytochrome c oxidase assembly factor Coa1 family protein [Pirellulales bacterium]|jgi:hypothetical protein
MLPRQIYLKSFVPITLLCMTLVLSGCGRIANHPLVNMAKEEVAINNRSQTFLGKPITWKGTVTGRANEVDGIAAMQIPVVGSKAAATVIVEGKKFGDEWGVTLLEIRPDNEDEKLSLTADLAARSGVETPKFDPNVAQPSSPKTALPPAEITIELPPGLPGQD